MGFKVDHSQTFPENTISPNLGQHILRDVYTQEGVRRVELTPFRSFAHARNGREWHRKTTHVNATILPRVAFKPARLPQHHHCRGRPVLRNVNLLSGLEVCFSVFPSAYFDISWFLNLWANLQPLSAFRVS